MEDIIKIRGLKKYYKDGDTIVHALDGIDLTIQKGEFTAIVGPSGSGKTTLLNMIGGLDRPTVGSVTISQTDITALSDNDVINYRRDNIGFVFQAYNLIPVLTALENVSFVLDLQGVNSKQSEKRAMELLKSVGLADRADARPSKLSGGQQQRVAVARALATSPKFILADEPTANLDSHSAESLLELMAEMNEKENITFIFSTHDERVMRKAKRIIKLIDGKIESNE